jgi:fatty-acyl-CoA synthase
VNVLDQVKNKAWVAYTMTNAGVIRPTRPDKLGRILLTLHRWGPTPAAGYTAAAIRYPDEIAIIDELGTLTFADVHKRTNALATPSATRASSRATA